LFSLFRTGNCGLSGFQLIIYIFCGFFFIIYIIFVFFFVCRFYGGAVFLDFFLFGIFGLDVSLSLIFDYVSLGFFSCVSFISRVVFYYRIFYMEGTTDNRRFL
jgi:NADH:ubiquinone oxidoreductase subunit 5 (subunit L)/multisubunit Na+/H+ antiporter MnhA subunit